MSPKPKLTLFCEGTTEAEILKPFLEPYWRLSFRDTQILDYQGSGNFKFKFPQDAQIELAAPDTYVLALIDLWGEPFGIYQAGADIEEAYHRLQTKLYSLISDDLHPRVGIFPVVMEIETWVLADPHVQKELQITLPQPEIIEHPSGEYLDKLFQKRYGAKRNYSQAKTREGKKLFQQATAQRVYDDNCPHFRPIIDWLKSPQSPLGSILAPKSSGWYLRRQKLDELEKRIKILEDALELATLPDEKATIAQALVRVWGEAEELLGDLYE